MYLDVVPLTARLPNFDTLDAQFYIFKLLEVARYLLYKTVWFSFVLFGTN